MQPYVIIYVVMEIKVTCTRNRKHSVRGQKSRRQNVFFFVQMLIFCDSVASCTASVFSFSA